MPQLKRLHAGPGFGAAAALNLLGSLPVLTELRVWDHSAAEVLLPRLGSQLVNLDLRMTMSAYPFILRL